MRHDAIEPCGFLIETPEARITILTDLGSWQEHLVAPIAASDLVVLEANHDVEMLQRGPYPVHLKRRVASPVGHLSNEASGQALARAMRDAADGTPVWLAHLSDTNNLPEVAVRTVHAALHGEGIDLDVRALPRRAPGPVWTSTPADTADARAPFSPTSATRPTAASGPAGSGGALMQRSLFD